MKRPPTAEPAAADLQRELESLHGAGFGWALICCRWNRDEAEEVLQTTYAKVIEGRAHFAGRSSTKTWLFGVIRRTALERRRQRTVRNFALGRWLGGRPDPAPAATPESLASRSQEVGRLRTALADLPRRQREVISLVFYADSTVEEAAGVLGISLGSARTHYHRAKLALRTKLTGGKTDAR